ncbi:MAG: DNA-binding response regulator, partial [Verrucomicrobiota bacterium]|nr:DNA-binding response regulator [Verrucomicrobiota bacterium]
MSNAADSFFKGKELLLLEDDLLLRKRLQAKLENMEVEVTPCETLEEARAALASMRFEFALFDLNLPDGESLDLFRES